jgi:hypothetical protein
MICPKLPLMGLQPVCHMTPFVDPEERVPGQSQIGRQSKEYSTL